MTIYSIKNLKLRRAVIAFLVILLGIGVVIVFWIDGAIRCARAIYETYEEFDTITRDIWKDFAAAWKDEA